MKKFNVQTVLCEYSEKSEMMQEAERCVVSSLVVEADNYKDAFKQVTEMGFSYTGEFEEVQS